jgi:hypothetical protein
MNEPGDIARRIVQVEWTYPGLPVRLEFGASNPEMI